VIEIDTCFVVTRGVRKTYSKIDMQKARVLVAEGRARFVSKHTIEVMLARQDFRESILVRDKYTCFYCGKYGDTIDHKVPRSKGGFSTPKNCVCACYDCNQDKGSMNLKDFMYLTNYN
jgi:5-methylcytosine-specific restriction endonuclease McrA